MDIYLVDMAVNTQLPPEARDLAAVTLQQWRVGIIPSEKTIKKLGQLSATVAPCTRVANDGGCGWLRVHGPGHQLPIPPQGERAICVYRDSFDKCPGYKRS